MSIYIATNEDLQKEYRLVSTDNDDVVVTKDYHSEKQTFWYISITEHDEYFRLHTLASGPEKALDVLGNHENSSAQVYFATIEDSPGQFWTLVKWADGTFSLSNNLTGPDMYLALPSGSMVPSMEYISDLTSPYWEIINALEKEATESAPPDAATSMPVATMNATKTTYITATSTAPTIQPSVSTGSQEKAVSLGAIVGSAIGGLAALTLCVCAVIYVLRRNRTKSVPTSAQEYQAPPAEQSNGLPDYFTAMPEKAQASTLVAPQSKQGQYYPESRNTLLAEAPGSNFKHFAEMP